jgi:hypothetical protein
MFQGWLTELQCSSGSLGFFLNETEGHSQSLSFLELVHQEDPEIWPEGFGLLEERVL